jgi:membrane protease YdiL (CAAX protease family)
VPPLTDRTMLPPSPRLHPLVRASLYYVAVIFGSQLVVGALLGVAVVGLSLIGVTGWQGEVLEGRLPAWLLALSTWMELGVLALATWGFLRFLDRAGWRTLRMVRQHWIVSTLSGAALGALAIGLLAALFAIAGWAQFHSGWTLNGLATNAIVLWPAALAEEIAFRGYLLALLARWRGWWLGAVGSSILFSLAHLLNPSLNFVALVNIALAGVAFALAMRNSNSLWLPTTFHFIWNYLLGPVFGLPVSGLTEFSAGAVAQVSGPPLWTGGAFGPEGGLAATLALIVVCLVLQVFHHARRARDERLANP